MTTNQGIRIRYWHVLLAIFLAYLLFQLGTLYGGWVERRFGEPAERPDNIKRKKPIAE